MPWDAARLGLDNLTHFYGLFEALYKDEDIQHWPEGFIYNDEQHRFSQVARQWDKIHPRGSKPWNDLIKEFLELDFIIDPTMTAYLAGRDVMRERTAEWHAKIHIAFTMGVLRSQPAGSRFLFL